MRARPAGFHVRSAGGVLRPGSRGQTGRSAPTAIGKLGNLPPRQRGQASRDFRKCSMSALSVRLKVARSELCITKCPISSAPISRE